jgi:hypothetical protein
VALQITGTWRLFVQPGWGEDVDWDALPGIVFAEGRITLDDGSHPDFIIEKGVLRFSIPMPGEAAGRRFANLAIDRGSDGHLLGWRYLADQPLREAPDPEVQLPDGDRHARIELIREDRLAAFRAEQTQMIAAQQRVLEDREPDKPASVTIH